MMPSCSSTQNQPCPATRLLQKISGKWKGIILYRFIQQSNWHFGELNASVSPCPTSDARSSTCATMRRWLHSKTYSNNPATRHNLSFNGGGDGTETDYSCYCTVGGILNIVTPPTDAS